MPDNKNIRVLVVDSQPIFIRGLVSLLESASKYKVCGQSGSIEEALEIAKKTKPHLAVIDVNLEKENGLSLISRLKTLDPEILILILSAHDERYYSERILRLGAKGYVMKNQSANSVLDAVKTVMAGKVYLSNSERERIFEAMTGDNTRGVNDFSMSLQKLSNRELQVFTLIGKGLGTIEIAARFNLSTKTIDTHKEHIKQKLHLNNSQEMRQLAIEWTNHPSL